MALAIDSQESGGTGHSSGGASTLSSTFNNVAGNLFLYGVVVSYGNPSTGVTVAATYNGVSMFHAPGSPFKWTNFGEDGYIALFELSAPPTGSHTVNVTVSQTTGTLADILGGGISFSGSRTLSPLGTLATNSTSGDATTAAPTVNLAGTTAGSIVVSVVADGEAIASATSPTILSVLENASDNTTSDNMAVGTQATSGGSVTAAYATAATDSWGIVAAEVFAGGSLEHVGNPIFRMQASPWR